MNRHPDLTTATGHHIYYDDLENLPFSLEDVRIASANIRRYVGHLDWKLIKHLCLCTRLAHHHHRRGQINNSLTEGYAAAHDFHEIYVADMPAGVKKYIQDYCKLEDIAENSVHRQLGLPIIHRPKEEVKYIDLRALVCEMYLLGHPSRVYCGKLYGGYPSEEEMIITRLVQNMSDDDCWKTICEAITATSNRVNVLSTDGNFYTNESELG